MITETTYKLNSLDRVFNIHISPIKNQTSNLFQNEEEIERFFADGQNAIPTPLFLSYSRNLNYSQLLVLICTPLHCKTGERLYHTDKGRTLGHSEILPSLVKKGLNSDRSFTAQHRQRNKTLHLGEMTHTNFEACY